MSKLGIGDVGSGAPTSGGGPGSGTARDEAARLAAVVEYDILDTSAERSFDRITGLVRTALVVPMAAISLIDRDRQWFKSHPGISVAEAPRNIAFCDQTIRGGVPLVVVDARNDPRFADNPLVTGDDGIASYAGVPLTNRDGYHVGTLCAIDRYPREFTAVDLDILTNLAAIVVDELELRRIARYDQLTGVLLRRPFLAEVTAAIARHDCGSAAGALLLFDLDHFKQVNDRAGHAAGDAVLRAVTQRCRDLLRAGDHLGRLGGEEFAVLLADTDADGAMAAAERFRAAIAGIAAPRGLMITASFGIALRTDEATAAAWCATADGALFAAKLAGRNCCRLAQERDAKAA